MRSCQCLGRCAVFNIRILKQWPVALSTEQSQVLPAGKEVPCTGGAINLKGFIPKGGLLQFVSSTASGAPIGTFLRNLKISDRNGCRVAQL